MASLSDGSNTTSPNKVNGVKLKGIKNVTYSGKVTVKNKTEDKYHYQTMSDQTNVNVKLGNGDYSVSNNSGGTINYEWL